MRRPVALAPRPRHSGGWRAGVPSIATRAWVESCMRSMCPASCWGRPDRKPRIGSSSSSTAGCAGEASSNIWPATARLNSSGDAPGDVPDAAQIVGLVARWKVSLKALHETSMRGTRTVRSTYAVSGRRDNLRGAMLRCAGLGCAETAIMRRLLHYISTEQVVMSHVEMDHVQLEQLGRVSR
jgi:hypothetical protein